MKVSIRFKLLAVVLVLIITLLAALGVQLVGDTTAFTSSLAQLLFRDNFHEVSAGRLYRSAEMSSERIDEVVEQYEIKTVLDLRLNPLDENGANLEREAVESHGVAYYSLPLRGTRVPQPEQLREMLELYRFSEEPILVHCTSGTHRSGVASAIWLIAVEEKLPSEAQQQLALGLRLHQARARI